MAKIIRCSALILGALIAFAIVGLFLVTRDEEPPDIADLAPRPLTASTDKNAFLILQKLAAEYATLPKDEDYVARLARLEDPASWTPADARHVIRDEEFRWDRFDTISGISQSDAAFTTETKPASYVSNLTRLWEAALIRVKLAARTTSPDEALALSLNTQSKALIVTDAGGTMIDTIVGIGLYATAHETLAAVLTSTSPSSEALRKTVVQLEKNRPSAAGFSDSFKTSYRRMPLEIDRMRNQHGSAGWLDLPRGAQWLYKPNQTARILAAHVRGFIQAIDQPYTKIEGFLPETGSPLLFARVPTPDNAFGKAYAEEIHVYTSMLKSRLKIQTSVSVTQSWIAVTLFERANGHFPDSLDQLVPEYVPAVPCDYFTGEAVRYSAIARAVWSAGEDDLILTSSDPEIPPRAIALRLKPPVSAP